ncbi:hypothetical protein MRX96_051321 [Rhipicephalus microplus]
MQLLTTHLKVLQTYWREFHRAPTYQQHLATRTKPRPLLITSGKRHQQMRKTGLILQELPELCLEDAGAQGVTASADYEFIEKRWRDERALKDKEHALEMERLAVEKLRIERKQERS